MIRCKEKYGRQWKAYRPPSIVYTRRRRFSATIVQCILLAPWSVYRVAMVCEAILGGDFSVDADSEIARLRRRDPDALTALIERYQYRLYRYLLRLTRDRDTADDLFQQTWLRVVDKIRRYDANRGFEPWLFSVARNLTIDHFRRRRTDSLDEPTATGEPAVTHLSAAAPDALTQFLASERSGLLVEKISGLPAVYREVITLRFEEEMKLEEIAAVTGAPEGTVKSRLRRALDALRRRLPPDLAGEGAA